MSQSELATMMQIKGDLLENVYETYKRFGHTGILPAVQAYNGIAFRQIPVESYSDEDLNYLEDHVRILSAMYGTLTPLTGMSAYRLDMKMKVGDTNLYTYWSKEVTGIFQGEALIVNLASTEFSKLVKLPMLTVNFKEYKQGKLKTIGTNAKKARGMMVNFMVKNRIEDPHGIKGFNEEGWTYAEDLSSSSEMLFVRGE